MNADEVRAWLAAQIDDDERAAKAAAGQGTDEMPGDNWTYDSAVAQIIDERGRIVLASGGAGGTWLGRERGTHIARHDPARVLRDVEAKRRRLERHAPCDSGTAGHPWCEWCTSNDEYEGWPCPDIVDDAQSYRDAPNFPAELRLP